MTLLQFNKVTLNRLKNNIKILNKNLIKFNWGRDFFSFVFCENLSNLDMKFTSSLCFMAK